MSRLLILLVALLPLPALALDCPFVPGKSLCGLPLDAGSARFQAVLGEADGQLRMGGGRTGLLFGGHFLLVFRDDRVERVHSWSQSSTEFLDSVGRDQRQSPVRLVLGDFSPWSRSRQQVGLALQSIPPVSADEFREHRLLPGAELVIDYASASGDPHNLGEWTRFQVEQLRLTLER